MKRKTNKNAKISKISKIEPILEGQISKFYSAMVIVFMIVLKSKQSGAFWKDNFQKKINHGDVMRN